MYDLACSNCPWTDQIADLTSVSDVCPDCGQLTVVVVGVAE